MRFEFEAAPTSDGRSLPVLREIPDGPIVWIEGRNGIGKSLSVRLLDLATGGAPYATHPDAWRSLRSGTGPISIRAANGDEIQFRLEPDRWADEPTRQSWDGLGTASIGGKVANREQIAERLRVVRIAGEEGLARAIGSQFTHLATDIEEYADSLSPKAEAADTALDALLRLLDRAASDHADEATIALRTAERELVDVVGELDPVECRLSTVDKAIRASESLDALRSRGPELEADIAAVSEELKRAHSRREAAVAGLAAAAASQPGSSVTKELDRIEKLVTRRERAAERGALEVSQLAGIANITPNEGVISEARAQVGADLAAESTRRGELTRADAVRSFLTRLLQLLSEANDLDPRAVVIELSDEPITREVLEDAVRARRSNLDQTDTAQEVDAADARIRDLIEQKEAIDQVAASLRRLRHKRAMVREALAELGVLEATFDDATGRFRKAREKLDAAVQDAERLTLDKQEAERALAALAEGSTEPELQALVAAANMPIDDLIPTRDNLRQQAAELQRTRDEANRKVDACRLSAAEAQSEQLLSREALAEEAQWAWFRSAVGVGDWTAAWTARVRQAVSASRETVNAAARNTRGIAETLRDIASHVSEARSLSVGTVISEAVLTACQDLVRNELMSESIRMALFNGAVVDAVDLRKVSVAWKEDGLSMIRPFSAFSSGEQAFAYIRARIEQVRKRQDEYLVLVLDEFSAFIAGDRRRLLNRLLAERIQTNAISKVVLIVPLSQDYVAAANEAGAEAGPILTRRASQVERVGYFAEQAQG